MKLNGGLYNIYNSRNLKSLLDYTGGGCCLPIYNSRNLKSLLDFVRKSRLVASSTIVEI